MAAVTRVRLSDEGAYDPLSPGFRRLIASVFRRRKKASPEPPRNDSRTAKLLVRGYELIKPLGEGAYSLVWLGRDSRGEYVAIKVSKPLSGDFVTQNEMTIFAEEVRRAIEVSYARAMMQYTSEFSSNVVRVLDINVGPVLRYLSGIQPYKSIDEYLGDPPFIVMEYIPDGSIVDNRRILLASPKMLLCTARQMVGAVKFVTEALSEKVHGDIKPDNVLVKSSGPTPIPVLTDFGTSVKITWRGWLYGTPEYMPPEGLLYRISGAVSSSYDAYSLGLTLYELLTGEVPSAQSLMIAVSRHPLLEPERRSPHVTRLARSFRESPGQLITVVERIVYSEQSLETDEIIERLERLENELETGELSHIRVHDLKALEEAVNNSRQPTEVVELIKDLVCVSPTKRPGLGELLKRIDEVIQQYGVECPSVA